MKQLTFVQQRLTLREALQITPSNAEGGTVPIAAQGHVRDATSHASENCGTPVPGKQHTNGGRKQPVALQPMLSRRGVRMYTHTSGIC
jgi:hypothetical protein